MLVTQTITFFNNREITCADIPTEWSEENVTILADALSQTYLSAGDLTVGWIYELRAQFAKDKLGTNVHFAKEFEKAISGYNTLLVSELKVYAKNIRKIVFNEKPSGFPEVRTSQFINALNSLAQKKKGNLSFTFQEKKEKGCSYFLSTGIFSLNGQISKATTTIWAPNKSIAREEASKLLYQKMVQKF